MTMPMLPALNGTPEAGEDVPPLTQVLDSLTPEAAAELEQLATGGGEEEAAEGEGEAAESEETPEEEAAESDEEQEEEQVAGIEDLQAMLTNAEAAVSEIEQVGQQLEQLVKDAEETKKQGGDPKAVEAAQKELEDLLSEAQDALDEVQKASDDEDPEAAAKAAMVADEKARLAVLVLEKAKLHARPNAAGETEDGEEGSSLAMWAERVAHGG